MEKEIIKPYGFIYITTNMVNGRRYIGQKKFNSGWQHYLGSGVLLLKAIKKYGVDNFNRGIIAIVYSKNELNQLEKQWITNYNAVKSNEFYNIADGGYENPFAGKTVEELNCIWRKISKKITGRKLSEITKVKLRNIHIGKPLSEEHKRKIGESVSGKNNGMYGNHSSIGKKLTKETRKKN